MIYMNHESRATREGGGGAAALMLCRQRMKMMKMGELLTVSDQFCDLCFANTNIFYVNR